MIREAVGAGRDAAAEIWRRSRRRNRMCSKRGRGQAAGEPMRLGGCKRAVIERMCRGVQVREEKEGSVEIGAMFVAGRRLREGRQARDVRSLITRCCQ